MKSALAVVTSIFVYIAQIVLVLAASESVFFVVAKSGGFDTWAAYTHRMITPSVASISGGYSGVAITRALFGSVHPKVILSGFMILFVVYCVGYGLFWLMSSVAVFGSRAEGIMLFVNAALAVVGAKLAYVHSQSEAANLQNNS